MIDLSDERLGERLGQALARSIQEPREGAELGAVYAGADRRRRRRTRIVCAAACVAFAIPAVTLLAVRHDLGGSGCGADGAGARRCHGRASAAPPACG